jgi:hypothetical protein
LDRGIRDLVHGWSRMPLRWAARKLGMSNEKDVVDLLHNPEATLAAIRKAQAQRLPLTELQQRIVTLAGAGGAEMVTPD